MDAPRARKVPAASPPPAPRMAVVLFPPSGAAGAAEEFRREHDPLFHKIAAHLSVVFPFRGQDEAQVPALLARAVRDGGRGPFPVSLGGAGRFDDGVVYFRVGEGADALLALHRSLSMAVLPPGSTLLPYVPHLTVGRGTGEAEAAFLERQVAGRLPPARFEATALSLVVEDARGLWLEVRRVPLAGG